TEVSRILRDHLRSSDIVVRWGGDEFVVIHACARIDAAAALAERIRSVVSTRKFSIGESRWARASCSRGFALHPFISAPPTLVSWAEVLKLADAALYRAKSQRNAWVGWCGLTPAPTLAARVIADPAAAEADQLIDVRKS